MQYEVCAAWMKATGQGETAQTFPVLRTWQAGPLKMALLNMGDGREWTVVVDWRGRFV